MTSYWNRASNNKIVLLKNYPMEIFLLSWKIMESK